MNELTIVSGSTLRNGFFDSKPLHVALLKPRSRGVPWLCSSVLAQMFRWKIPAAARVMTSSSDEAVKHTT
ncbi:BZ3500_MvSof-1268-A1-R1_Chr4-2g07081 [Microbotryum saponariae]|uniref:BZ3500_MvSof-1268-A1-R1_Chr4-2g07081 protein n=1 Tax=Microbotryum saponariae TaxID=289078 RepID=A0A2X0NKU3_9BASI|nr:BZ3500_MvSof-1268-A1-R1_Chr4-2g07081 [Microbotryum saponariae]SDA06746.1 BZ3501_MvSof-1269-A2-R1_Chr4-2g06792 [Microbotryum saponariae]